MGTERNVKEHMVKYKIAQLCCFIQVRHQSFPPWKEKRVKVIIEPLSTRKHEHIPSYLKA